MFFHLSSRHQRLAFLVLFIAVASTAAFPQTPAKPIPTQIGTQIWIVGEQVVQDQWPNTLNPVNAPTNLQLLNPGQCFRVGIMATGDERDALLENTQISFEVEFAKNKYSFPPAPAAAMKQIKPQGGDFVTQALSAAGVKNPVRAMATLAVSADKWCVPDGAADGTATIHAQTVLRTTSKELASSMLQIESYEKGRQQKFADIASFGRWLQSYHWAPEPARLLPALEFASASQTNSATIFGTFFIAAFKSDPVAAASVARRLPSENSVTRIYALSLLKQSGSLGNDIWTGISDRDRREAEKIPPMPNAFDMRPDRELPEHLDMLWATFSASGRIDPIRAVASALEWRSDFESFDTLRKSGQERLALTESVMRGVSYMAAGWSLSSFQTNDRLAADYIEFLATANTTSPAVKNSLESLSSEPAFKRN